MLMVCILIYNPKYTYGSPTRRPLNNSTIKTYNSRPTSSLRTKTETDSTSPTPSPNDHRLKKPSISRLANGSPLILQPTSPTKTFEPRPHVYRLRTEDGNSNSFLNKTPKYDRPLNIDTSPNSSNTFSSPNLKGYSVTNPSASTSFAYARKISNIASPVSGMKISYNASPLSSSFGYSNGITSTGRGNTPPPNAKNSQNAHTPLRKPNNSRTYGSNTSMTTASSSNILNRSGSSFYNPAPIQRDSKTGK